MNSVDKSVEKVVDKKKTKYSNDTVSPYLRRPLRSLSDALADRARPVDGSLAMSDYRAANDHGRRPARPSAKHGV